MAIDKPTKPTELLPRSFGGEKTNFDEGLQQTGFEANVPAIYAGANVNYQINATGQELDYCEKIVDYINATPIGKTLMVDSNNKLTYTDTLDKANKLLTARNINGVAFDGTANVVTGLGLYSSTTTYNMNNIVYLPIDESIKIFRSKINDNTGHPVTDDDYWEEISLGSGSGSAGLKIGTMFFSQGFVDTSKGLEIEANGQEVQASSLPADFVSWVNTSDSLNTDFATTEQNWQAEAALNPDGICGKYVINRDESNNITSIRFPKYPNWAVQNIYGNVPVVLSNPSLIASFTDGTRNYGVSSGNEGGSGNIMVLSTNAYNQTVGSNNAIGSTPSNHIGVRLGNLEGDTNLKVDLNNINSIKIKGKWYIQIATGQKTEVIFDNKQEMLSALTLFEPKYSATPLYDVKYGLANSTHLKTTYPSAYEALLVEQNSNVAVGTTVNITDTFSYTKRGLDVKETGDSAITDYSWVVDKTAENFTCPKKSLIYPSQPTDISLYFCIAAVGQNAALANLGRISEEISNRTTLAQAARASMPTNRYVDFTLGASGSNYTVPADGWLYLRKGTNGTNQYIAMGSSSSGISTKCANPLSNNVVMAYIPVIKSQECWITYNAGGTTEVFRFIYAEGAE